jgi:hypothetical protein
MTGPLDIFEDPMERRELLDRYRRLPIWVRLVSKMRFLLGI